MGMQPASQDRAADRAVFARMQVRHAGDGGYAGEARYLIELSQGFALDPGAGRGEQVYGRSAVTLVGVAHDFAFAEMGLRSRKPAGRHAHIQAVREVLTHQP